VLRVSWTGETISIGLVEANALRTRPFIMSIEIFAQQGK